MIPPPFSSCTLCRETLLTWRRRRRRRRRMVGSVGSFHEWLSEYGKRQCRSFLRRARAAIKKKRRRSGGGGGGGGGGKRRVNKFQYDPWSYALNFDDGVGKVERADAVLVFVLWVKPQ